MERAEPRSYAPQVTTLPTTPWLREMPLYAILPVFHPLDGALLEDGRVALAPLPELGAG